jgi:hypothetical protein
MSDLLSERVNIGQPVIIHRDNHSRYRVNGGGSAGSVLRTGEATLRLIGRARAAYVFRWEALVAALGRHGIVAHRASGLNV